MTQTNNHIKKIEEVAGHLLANIKAYEKVDATLSEETLKHTLFFLNSSNEELESGFVKDSCKEIDNAIDF